jgi:hypothetical protein
MQPICTHKISVQSSKPSHAYPIIRLPRAFRRLAGVAATIYETTHNGGLAFLVVPNRKDLNGHKSDLDTDIENTSLYTAKVGRSNRLEPICFRSSFDDITQQRSSNELSTCRQFLDTNDCETSQYPREVDEKSHVSGQADTQNNGQTLGNLVLAFMRDELCSYVDARIIGLADTSRDWVVRAARTLWLNSRREISQRTIERLRVTTLAQYSSVWSHGKTLAFAKSFLKYLTKMRLDNRYLAFDMFLEMLKKVKTRKAVTSRIITKADIENVLAHIERAKREGRISERRALEYKAFVVFGAYAGQRTMATMSRLTAGQFREALQSKKPVLRVTAQQDKIRMDLYAPLHQEVVKALGHLCTERTIMKNIFV